MAVLSDEEFGVAPAPSPTSAPLKMTVHPEPKVMTDNEFGLPSSPGDDQAVEADAIAPSGSLPAAFADIPHEVYQAGSDALSSINENLNPFSEAYAKRMQKRMDEEQTAPFYDITPGLKNLRDTGKGLMALPALVTAPISGVQRSLLGHPLADITGMPYEEAKGDIDTIMMGVAPGRGGLALRNGPVAAPKSPIGPHGVTLSEGQATGSLPKIQVEQAGLRGQLGPEVQARAKQFAEQQKDELTGAKQDISSGFDDLGLPIASSAQEAGDIVSRGVQAAAAAKRAEVKAKYKDFEGIKADVDAGVVRGVGTAIKNELSDPDRVGGPVIVDNLTQNASTMLDYLDNQISHLIIKNKAQPTGTALASSGVPTIGGVSMNGIDQIRKNLAEYRNRSYDPQKPTDYRATSAIIDAFDNRIDEAFRAGKFTGDPRALQAWLDARAANVEYRSKFSGGRGDPVGDVVEKILGKGQTPAAIPNDVADFMYGSIGTNPNTLNVAVANRARDILGPKSEQWSAVRQGLFSRLVEPPPNAKEWTPNHVAQNLNKFLNGDGKEMAQAMYSPQERRLLQSFANLQRQLEVPQAGAQWSNNAGPLLQKITKGVGAIVGTMIGHAVAPGLYGSGEVAGAWVGSRGSTAFVNAKNMRLISDQMPIAADAIAKWKKAASAAAKQNTPLSNAALSAATANLARAVAPLGVDINRDQNGGR